jgi:hypothetical protein
MAISGKPQKPARVETGRVQSELDVVALINKGGSVAKASTPPSAGVDLKPMLVQLRFYPDLVEEIDAVRKATGGKRHRPPSRHAWIVSAIEEKLARDKPGT